MKKIRPQEGYQMNVLSSSADIVIGGGAAGVGKTFALLLEFIRHLNNPKWGGVIFRRTSPQIRLEGGLWDTSTALYPLLNATPKETTLEWFFPKGAKLKFSHLEYEKNILDWQGSQIPFIGFDELTHFSEKMFFYLLSRNRSMCGVKPYVRATCNPDPDSWVAKLIEWWIDQDTGFPIPERDGVVRYFIKNDNQYIWGDSKQEVIELSMPILKDAIEKSGINPESFVKSLTFVSGSIYHNKELLKVNPEYLGNLMAQDEATKNALLHGNWKMMLNENDIYEYHSFIGMFNNSINAKTGKRYITADIAMKGSNKFVIGCWDGFELIDIELMDVSNGNDVIVKIKEMAKKHGVQNKNIAFDADGVGSFVDGFITGSYPFNGNSSPIKIVDKTSNKFIKPNYKNLKTQLVYISGNNVNTGKYIISEHVANKMYDKSMTIRQRFVFERKAFKRDKVDSDGKLCIIGKDEMKLILLGDSPDLIDMFFMREIFEITRSTAPVINW